MFINNQIQTTLINYYYKKLSICHHISNKASQGQEANFESYMFPCYFLVNPNKSVHPIAIQKCGIYLGVG